MLVAIVLVVVMCDKKQLVGAVTCDSFGDQASCNGVVTDSGTCTWDKATNECASDGLGPGEGLVGITSVGQEEGVPAEEPTARQQQDGSFCTQDAETGNCRGMFPSWYYDAKTNSCERFIYGGCGGNDNRFETGDACVAAAEQFCSEQTQGQSVTIESAAVSVGGSGILSMALSVLMLWHLGYVIV